LARRRRATRAVAHVERWPQNRQQRPHVRRCGASRRKFVDLRQRVVVRGDVRGDDFSRGVDDVSCAGVLAPDDPEFKAGRAIDGDEARFSGKRKMLLADPAAILTVGTIED
jgi:hypothetical protein